MEKLTNNSITNAVDNFQTFGFAVLRNAFDAAAIISEVDLSLRISNRGGFTVNPGGGVINGRYVPMMCERTPVSIDLLHRFADLASQFLSKPVLPSRAKGVQYAGATGWHRDSCHSLCAIGFLAYLDPLDASSGALRVMPGSHRGTFAEKIGALVDRRGSVAPERISDWVRSLPSHVIETSPGDIIVLDEHLFHASADGLHRRQWRVDFVADDRATGDELSLRDYYASQYTVGWDGGYDVDLFPSYGAHWLKTARPQWNQALSHLGVYEMAAKEEAYMRQLHTSSRRTAKIVISDALSTFEQEC